MLDKALIGGASALAAGGIGFGAFAAYRDRKRKREAERRPLIPNQQRVDPDDSYLNDYPNGYNIDDLPASADTPVMYDGTRYFTSADIRHPEAARLNALAEAARVDRAMVAGKGTSQAQAQANRVAEAMKRQRQEAKASQVPDRFDTGAGVDYREAAGPAGPPVPLTPVRPVNAVLAAEATTAKRPITPGSAQSHMSGGSFDMQMSDLGSIQGRSRAGSAASSVSGVGDMDALVPNLSPIAARSASKNGSIFDRVLAKTQDFLRGPNSYRPVVGQSDAAPSTPRERVIVPETVQNSDATPATNYGTARQTGVAATPDVSNLSTTTATNFMSPLRFNPRTDTLSPLYSTPIQIVDANSQLNRPSPATVYRTPNQAPPQISEALVPNEQGLVDVPLTPKATNAQAVAEANLQASLPRDERPSLAEMRGEIEEETEKERKKRLAADKKAKDQAAANAALANMSPQGQTRSMRAAREAPPQLLPEENVPRIAPPPANANSRRGGAAPQAARGRGHGKH